MFITIHWIHCWLAFGWKWKQHRTERKRKRASEQQKLAQHRESGFGFWLAGEMLCRCVLMVFIVGIRLASVFSI